jgi:hypothetical protein
MDPITAVSLAANVVQFISFAREVLSMSKELSQNVQGATNGNLELESMTRNLFDLSQGLVISVPVKKKKRRGYIEDDEDEEEGYEKENHTSRSELELRVVCDRLKGIASTLLRALDDVKMKNNNSSKWSGIGTALKLVLSADKINHLVAQLERYQIQFNTTLLASLRYVKFCAYELC